MIKVYKVTLRKLKGKSKTNYSLPSFLFRAGENSLQVLADMQAAFRAKDGYKVEVGQARLSDLTANRNDDDDFLCVADGGAA